MINPAKKSHSAEHNDDSIERRNYRDRRTSNSKTRFPFIDDNHKLVMKERRVMDRRETDANRIDKSLKVVKGLFKK